MFFSTKIFQMARLSQSSAQLATLLMGSINVLMTVVSLFLVEMTGRKTLLLIGFGGMFIDTIFLAIGLINVVSRFTMIILSQILTGQHCLVLSSPHM